MLGHWLSNAYVWISTLRTTDRLCLWPVPTLIFDNLWTLSIIVCRTTVYSFHSRSIHARPTDYYRQATHDTHTGIVYRATKTTEQHLKVLQRQWSIISILGCRCVCIVPYGKTHTYWHVHMCLWACTGTFTYMYMYDIVYVCTCAMHVWTCTCTYTYTCA